MYEYNYNITIKIYILIFRFDYINLFYKYVEREKKLVFFREGEGIQ